MNDVVIRILDTSNTVLGDLDLTSFTDFPLVLTKGIVNLDNLKARTGTFSKTFKVPNTKNNANLLSNVDNINSRKDYRDALNRKPCVIIVSGTQIDKGFIQVGKVFDGFELDSYELVFFGNNIDWVKGASELKLNSITYANNSQVYNELGINTANGLNSDTYNHAYPYISRGGNEDGQNAEVRDFYPVFYLRSLIRKGLNSLGWNIESSFLNDVNVKRLVCDLNPNFTINDDTLNESITRAESTSSSTMAASFNARTQVYFADDSTPPNEDVNNNYNNSDGTYTAPSDGTYIFDVSINTGNWLETRTGVTLNAAICVGTGNTFGVDTVVADNELISVSTTSNETSTARLTVSMTTGQKASVFCSYFPFTFGSGAGDILSGTFFHAQRKTEMADGDLYSLNEIIPNGITLLDVINDFTRMFNIYYWTDVKTKTIYLEPRDTFFQSKTSALDWTNKLDIGKGYEVDYISSYKRNIEFKYKDLNNDEWLKGWQDLNKRTYARYNYVLPDRFAEGTNTVELGLFSASYAHNAYEVTPITGTSFNANLGAVTLKIWDEYLVGGNIPTKRITDYNPKIYLFNNGVQTGREISIFNNTTSIIPYGIFETYNNTTSDINLSFTGTDGLFSTYYSKMFKNIEEGGRLVAYLNLTSTDIDNLDFRKLVYIDRPSKVSGYYLIEQVIDYNPLSDGLTKVSLFKFENLGSVAIDGSQEGNNSDNEDNGNTPAPLQPIYVEDGSNLIEVYIENPVTGLIEPVYR
jgi:hypothetical protein